MRYAPQTIYVIGRHIPDPADTNSYYVRAYVFDAKTFTLLETLNLTDRGNGTHTIDYRLPIDPSGSGRQLLVKTTVFTDAGYTTKSELYAEELESDVLVIADSAGKGGGGAVSSWSEDIDYKRIEKIVADQNKQLLGKTEQLIKSQDKVTGFATSQDVQEACSEVLTKISSIEPSKTDKVDFQPILTVLKDISDLIKNGFSELRPTLDLKKSSENIEINKETLAKIEKNVALFGNFSEKIEEYLSKFDSNQESISSLVVQKIKEEKNAEEEEERRIEGIKSLML